MRTKDREIVDLSNLKTGEIATLPFLGSLSREHPVKLPPVITFPPHLQDLSQPLRQSSCHFYIVSQFLPAKLGKGR